MTRAFSWQNSVSLCPVSFCTPRPNLPINPGISWLPTFSFQPPIMKRTSFSGVSSRRSWRSSLNCSNSASSALLVGTWPPFSQSIYFRKLAIVKIFFTLWDVHFLPVSSQFHNPRVPFLGESSLWNIVKKGRTIPNSPSPLSRKAPNFNKLQVANRWPYHTLQPLP